MKKVVVLGGGTGLSNILKGLKLFPLDITAIVCMTDDGRSTGRLREEFKIPAVGDITSVLLSLSDADQKLDSLMKYRFINSKSLGNHSIKNLLMTALIDINGNLAKSIPVFCKLINIKGKVLPLTEDSVDLVGISTNNKRIVGETNIGNCKLPLKKICFSKKINVNSQVIKAINEADLIILSSGSILTSITPHLIDKKIIKAIDESKASLMYICNLFTQPSESDNYSASDHVKHFDKYLNKKKVSLLIANTQRMSKYMENKYLTKENKKPVVIDEKELKNMDVKIIKDKLLTMEDKTIKHDSLKTAYLIFRYIMEYNK